MVNWLQRVAQLALVGRSSLARFQHDADIKRQSKADFRGLFYFHAKHLAAEVRGSLTMLGYPSPVETASTYFTRRARQEREKAADASSAEARKAHLELAVRLVRVATECALWSDWPRDMREGADLHHQTAVAPTDLGKALANAFALPPSDAFEHLLSAVDERTSSASSNR